MINEQGSKRQKKRKHIFEQKQGKHGNPTPTGIAPTITTGMAPTVTSKASTATTTASTGANAVSVNGIRLDAVMARNAIIMSEIIGPPKAKRRRGRCY